MSVPLDFYTNVESVVKSLLAVKGPWFTNYKKYDILQVGKTTEFKIVTLQTTMSFFVNSVYEDNLSIAVDSAEFQTKCTELWNELSASEKEQVVVNATTELIDSSSSGTSLYDAIVAAYNVQNFQKMCVRPTLGRTVKTSKDIPGILKNVLWRMQAYRKLDYNTHVASRTWHVHSKFQVTGPMPYKVPNFLIEGVPVKFTTDFCSGSGHTADFNFALQMLPFKVLDSAATIFVHDDRPAEIKRFTDVLQNATRQLDLTKPPKSFGGDAVYNPKLDNMAVSRAYYIKVLKRAVVWARDEFDYVDHSVAGSVSVGNLMQEEDYVLELQKKLETMEDILSHEIMTLEFWTDATHNALLENGNYCKRVSIDISKGSTIVLNNDIRCTVPPGFIDIPKETNEVIVELKLVPDKHINMFDGPDPASGTVSICVFLKTTGAEQLFTGPFSKDVVVQTPTFIDTPNVVFFKPPPFTLAEKFVKTSSSVTQQNRYRALYSIHQCGWYLLCWDPLIRVRPVVDAAKTVSETIGNYFPFV